MRSLVPLVNSVWYFDLTDVSVRVSVTIKITPASSFAGIIDNRETKAKTISGIRVDRTEVRLTCSIDGHGGAWKKEETLRIEEKTRNLNAPTMESDTRLRHGEIMT